MAGARHGRQGAGEAGAPRSGRAAGGGDARPGVVGEDQRRRSLEMGGGEGGRRSHRRPLLGGSLCAPRRGRHPGGSRRAGPVRGEAGLSRREGARDGPALRPEDHRRRAHRLPDAIGRAPCKGDGARAALPSPEAFRGEAVTLLAIDWHHLLLRSVVTFNEFVIYYFLTLNTAYLLLFIVSLFEVVRFVRRTFFSDYQQILKSEMTWPISILVPAFNEERGIVDTLRSLLQLNYGEFEIVVVNDGSTDSTLEQLIKAFDLRQTDRVYRRTLPTSKVRGIYASLQFPSLTVVDKEKGGKPDALNTGINISRYPLFCSVDADSVIEENALLRVVKPFMEHPEEMVAVGGIVRIVNGCEVRDGRVIRIGLPRRALPVFQVVEYLRAFLSGRIGWSVMRSLLIISGAFGLYKKTDVIAVGGYDSFTDTEDLELVVKLHEYLKKQRMKYRIVFVPDPVCWTEVPEKFKTLLLQRNRWHRGLLQSFRRHWRMLFNPRYGVIGTLALPYFLLFEMLGPFVEVLGYLSVIAAYFLGILNREFFLLFLLVAIFYGVFLSIAAVLLEEISFRRYPGWEDLARLIWYSIWENIGFRQLLALFKVKAFFDFIGRRRRWGEMGHRGFHNETAGSSPTMSRAASG